MAFGIMLFAVAVVTRSHSESAKSIRQTRTEIGFVIHRGAELLFCVEDPVRGLTMDGVTQKAKNNEVEFKEFHKLLTQGEYHK